MALEQKTRLMTVEDFEKVDLLLKNDAEEGWFVHTMVVIPKKIKTYLYVVLRKKG